MKRWEEYQHQAAGLLRELGFSAEVDAQLAEANGAIHAIDVAARRTVAGVDLLWIVECKYWSKPVDMGAVRDLRTLVLDLGADRGLLMSESRFQSGAILAAKQKNITLTNLDDLRANAADEILAARVAMAEKRLMDLSLRVNRDLRPSTLRTVHMLASLAARLPPHVVQQFAARPEAIEFVHGITEVQRLVKELTLDDHLEFTPHPGEVALPWRPGADGKVLDGVVVDLHYTTQALYQGKLGQWPAMCVSASKEVRPETGREVKPERNIGFIEPKPGVLTDWIKPQLPDLGEVKLAWSMPQLIDVIEPKLAGLEEKISAQEARSDQTPRPPWLPFFEPGKTLHPPHPWKRGVSD
jgi:hypothetical protein